MALKRFLLVALFVLQGSLAWAGCTLGALPFQLQNNTVADATQVMANFNQVVTGANANCAAAGANNDITSLGALSTPLSPAQGGTPVFTGGTTGGAANAQTIAVNSNFTFGTGYHVTGFWGFTNTAALTLSVNGTSQPVWRQHQFGLSNTAGGEAIAGHPFDVVWNGGAWLLTGPTIMIGEMKAFAYDATGVSLPPGWLVTDGSSFVCTTYQDLCNVIGTTYGGTSANPNLPDTRGRVLAGMDNYHTNGAAARLNNVATGCGSPFNFIGAVCANGSQSHTQVVAELAAHNHPAAGTGSGNVIDPGHQHTYTTLVGGSGAAAGTSFQSGTAFTGGSTTGITVPSLNLSITTSNTGSGQAMPIVNPNLAQVILIRF